MSRFSLKFHLSETNSGTLYEFEEESDQKKETFYAFDLSSDIKDSVLKDEEEKLKDCNSVRHYAKQITHQNKKYYLFKFGGGQTLDREIKNSIGKNQSIKLDTIKLYLTQILDTLYQLHQKQILGRVFSTKNIMVNDGQILFMDFGFGPKFLTENIDLIAPPEIIEKFVENQPSDYDMKVDSWLLGTVLFHLVKLRPIAQKIEENKAKNMVYKDIKEYWDYLKNQMSSQDYINAKTDRYPEEFCQFIQGLLTYNPQKRLSFLQIYQTNFIKNLNLTKYYDYVSYYTKDNTKWINEQIRFYTIGDSDYIETRELQNPQSVLRESQHTELPTISPTTTPKHSNYIPYLDLKSNLTSQTIIVPGTTSRINWLPEVINKDYIENSFIYQIQGLYQSKFYEIWSHVRMELFRCTFLEKCAEEFVVELGKKQKYQLEHVLAYFLRKMSYLILIELQKKLNEDVCPWRCNQENLQKWKDFQKESQYKILENSIIQKIKELAPILRTQFSDQCQKYQKEENIEEEIRKQLQEDQSCFQSQTKDSSPIYKCCSDEFLRNGYRNLIQLTFRFLQAEQKFKQQPQLNYNTLLLKILLCHLINRIFNLSNAQNTFEHFLKNRKNNALISPNEIYSYICRDDELGKVEDIKYISNISFTDK